MCDYQIVQLGAMQDEARNLMAALVLAQVDNTREDLGSRRRSAVGSATRRRST